VGNLDDEGENQELFLTQEFLSYMCLKFLLEVF
jgi:hypothetical protein